MKRYVQSECENCGSTEITFNKKTGLYRCNYCRSEFQVDNTKEEAVKVAKGIGIGYAIIIGLVFLVIIGSIIFSFITFSKATSIFGNVFNKATDSMMGSSIEKENTTTKNYNAKHFNSIYEMYSGSSYTLHVESLLDNVVTNNKTNDEHVITITYNDKTTSNPDEIVNIKHSLPEGSEFEVSLDYNQDGYVYNIKIIEIKK